MEFPSLAMRVKSAGKQNYIEQTASAAICRPLTYKSSEEQMESAYTACQGSTPFSVRRIAEEFGVPRSTLQDGVAGRKLPRSMCGKRRYLNDKEESDLVDFLMKCARIGFPRSRSDVISLVQDVCDHRGIETKVSHGWWERMCQCQRHPSLTLRAAANLSRARMLGSSFECISA